MHFFIQTKRNSHLNTFILTLFFIGFLFGTYYYKNSNEYVLTILNKLFYQTTEEYLTYQNYYLYISFFYFFLSFILSSSYLGLFTTGFLIFTKGLQFSFSLCLLFASNLTFEVFVLGILPQIIFEFAIFYVLSFLSVQLSINAFNVSFIKHETIRLSRLINYLLDYSIIVLVLFVCSILYRVYLL